MKNFIIKHWALIGLIAAFVLDHIFDILKSTGLSEIQIDLIQGLGIIVVGYFWNPKDKKESPIVLASIPPMNPDDEEIGGGGIKNKK